MAIAVTIDFDQVYEIEPLSADLRESMFNTELIDGTELPLKIVISNQPHPILPDVYNLAFGPVNSRGLIDDKAEIEHADYSKTFSSILLTGLTYLSNNPTHFLGIDGSHNARASLYYRFIQRNYDYLTQYFVLNGIKYYVRISRFGKHQFENPFDFKDIYSHPDPIIKGRQIRSDWMYNYFIFKLKTAH